MKAHNFGVMRKVDRQLPLLTKTLASGVKVYVCRALLSCGHVVRREHEIKGRARCYECRS